MISASVHASGSYPGFLDDELKPVSPILSSQRIRKEEYTLTIIILICTYHNPTTAFHYGPLPECYRPKQKQDGLDFTGLSLYSCLLQLDPLPLNLKNQVDTKLSKKRLTQLVFKQDPL